MKIMTWRVCMIINHNMSSMYANRTLGTNNANIAGNIEKLSSGLKINKAGDDASGLAVSEKMRSQIRGLITERNIKRCFLYSNNRRLLKKQLIFCNV